MAPKIRKQFDPSDNFGSDIENLNEMSQPNSQGSSQGKRDSIKKKASEKSKV